MQRSFLFLSFLVTFLFADPVLFVEAPHYDFGEAATNSIVQHEFVLENRGTDPLVIHKIKSSCGCTTSGVSRLELEPGEKKNLFVEMDLKGRVGRQTQHVTLSTSDPERQTFSLKITGEAVPDIRVEPRTLNLMQADADSPHTGTLTLTSTNGEPFKVKSVVPNRNRVTTAVEPGEDGKKAVITVTALPQEGSGNFTDVLEIDTDNPDVEGVRVLVMWQKHTGVSVAPGQVRLILRDEEAVLDRYLMVRGYPGLEEPLEVTDVIWEGFEDVEIGLKDTEKYGWRIHLKKFTPREEMKDSEIEIHTNAAGFEVLKVPVRVIRP